MAVNVFRVFALSGFHEFLGFFHNTPSGKPGISWGPRQRRYAKGLFSRNLGAFSGRNNFRGVACGETM
jgi:hypothetical protein